MAFEQNQQLRRLLDPVALQQMSYDRDQQRRYFFPQMQQQQNQFQPLQQNYRQPGIQSAQLGGQQPGWLEWLRNGLIGTPAHQIQSTDYSPNQQMGHEFLLQQGANALNDPYAGFGPLQDYLYKQFNEQTVPDIAERFTGIGGGRTSSPDFIKQLGGASQGLTGMLAAQKAQFGQQNRQFGLQALNQGLQPYQQNTYVPRQPGLPENLINYAAQGLGMVGGNALVNRFAPQLGGMQQMGGQQ